MKNLGLEKRSRARFNSKQVKVSKKVEGQVKVKYPKQLTNLISKQVKVRKKTRKGSPKPSDAILLVNFNFVFQCVFHMISLMY